MIFPKYNQDLFTTFGNPVCCVPTLADWIIGNKLSSMFTFSIFQRQLPSLSVPPSPYEGSQHQESHVHPQSSLSCGVFLPRWHNLLAPLLGLLQLWRSIVAGRLLKEGSEQFDLDQSQEGKPFWGSHHCTKHCSKWWSEKQIVLNEAGITYDSTGHYTDAVIALDILPK